MEISFESDSKVLKFDARPNEDHKFDLECALPSCSKPDNPIFGQVHVSVVGDGSVPEEAVTINADIEVIRGYGHDDLVRQAELVLTCDSFG